MRAHGSVRYIHVSNTHGHKVGKQGLEATLMFQRLLSWRWLAASRRIWQRTCSGMHRVPAVLWGRSGPQSVLATSSYRPRPSSAAHTSPSPVSDRLQFSALIFQNHGECFATDICEPGCSAENGSTTCASGSGCCPARGVTA